MRDRLIEAISQKQNGGWRFVSGEYTTDVTNEELADHLLANGVIVPPCKVGDTVYRVVEPLIDDSFVIEGIVFEYAETFEAGKTKKRIYFWAKGEDFTRRAYSLWLEISEFGKTVFLTREEAVKVLKGGGEK